MHSIKRDRQRETLDVLIISTRARASAKGEGKGYVPSELACLQNNHFQQRARAPK